jgi:phosphate transport system substrate-binding protein
MKDGDSLPANAFTAGNTAKVIDYVHEARNAIGLIGYAWIADRDSPRVREFLEKTTLMRMQCPPESDMPGGWVRPYQAEIKLKRWPLTQPIWAVSREHFVGLGTGFVVFLGGEEGQSILLKAGLVAAFPPPREVIMPPIEKEDN